VAVLISTRSLTRAIFEAGLYSEQGSKALRKTLGLIKDADMLESL